MMRRIAAIAIASFGLAACSSRPLGDPVWSDWDTGREPVTAYEIESGAATGAIGPAPVPSRSYDSWTPAETGGRAPLAPLESAPLAPPPGSSASPAGAGPRADLPPDPYQSRYIQRTRPIAVTGLGSQVATPAGAPRKTITQRTLPLVVAGTGKERGTE